MTASTRRGAARPARCGACLHGDRAGIVGAARYRCSCVMCWLWPRAGVLACPCPCACMCVITTRCDYPTARDIGAASSVVRKASRSEAVRVLPHSETSPTRRDALSGLEANLARHLDSSTRRTFCLSPRRLVARRGHTHAHSDGMSRFPLTVLEVCWMVGHPTPLKAIETSCVSSRGSTARACTPTARVTSLCSVCGRAAQAARPTLTVRPRCVDGRSA